MRLNKKRKHITFIGILYLASTNINLQNNIYKYSVHFFEFLEVHKSGKLVIFFLVKSKIQAKNLSNDPAPAVLMQLSLIIYLKL